ncbi:importin-9 [Cocos nucifera]|uniref:Importin-9 n=1 Tax=Cocos nucifera TaxID=13894 RepID=A0A8K0HVK7_COCNU|nr:importin-9 [Cocos nucifera]
MEAVVDQDQKWLIDCLTATLDTNREVCSIGVYCYRPGIPDRTHIEMILAVLLKQFIKQHWQEDEETFIHPVVSAAEKGVIRQLLLPSLDDSHGKIRTAVSMAVVSIAQYDWPEDWPELLPFLLKLISDQSNIGGVRGALRCLALLSGDLDDTLVPRLVPALFPYLNTILSSPHLYEKPLRAKALSIIHSCISVLGSMSGVYKSETIALIMPMLSSLMEQFSIILQPPVQSEDPDDWSIRMEVLKCLLQFVQNFPSLTEAQFSGNFGPVIVAPLWQTFVSSLEVYQLSSIQGSEDSHSGRYDSDGVEQSLESFVIQLFEFLLTMVGTSRLAEVIRMNIKELVYYTIAFLQMTEEQIHTWSLDPNQYVADEDDVTYSCRVSGSLLLEEIVNAFDGEGIDSIIEASEKRFNESCQAKVAGSADWWRLREASLFVLVSLSEQLLEAQASGLTKFNLENLLEQMITEDMGMGLMEILSFGSPPPVKVGACRALSQLLPESNHEIMQPYIMGLLSSLTELLRQASDETLHLVLDTLQATIKAGHEQSTSIEPVISPIILNVWAQNVSDPFTSIDAVEVLENAPLDVVKAVFDICFNHTIQIILQSDDHGEMQNATECLAAFLSGGRLDLLQWGGDPGLTMKSLLDAASRCKKLCNWVGGGTSNGLALVKVMVAPRLLDPDLESSGSLFVGSYILQLILHLPSQMSMHIRELVAAVVRRLQSCEIAGLKSSLIVILARLVHISSPDVDQFINLLLTIPAKGFENSFAYVMSEWTKLQGITTRSKAKLAPDRWTIIPLPAKIFSLLSDTLLEIQEQALDDDDHDEDSDWEEVPDDDGGIPRQILYSSTVPSHVSPSVEHLDAMAKVLDEIKLADFLTNFFVNLSNSDGSLFNYLCQSLTYAQRSAVEKVLSK